MDRIEKKATTNMIAKAARYLVCVVLFCHSQAYSDDAMNTVERKSSFAKTPVSPSVLWTEVDDVQRWVVIRFLADEIVANYHKIHTWQGVYHIRSAEGQRELDLKAGFGDELGDRDLSDIELVYEYQVRFALEATTQSIFRDIQTDQMYWVDGRNGEHFVIPNTAPVDNRSFVTPDDYVYLNPDLKIPETTYLPGNPKAMNKRAAFRGPVRAGQRKHYGNMLDPLVFFGYSLDTRIWESMNGWADAHKGKFGNETKRYFDRFTAVFEAVTDSGKIYKVVIGREHSEQHADADKVSESQAEFVFREEAGFNSVGYVLYNSDGQKCQSMRWKWDEVDGIYIPAATLEMFVPCPGQTRRLWREAELTDCKVNGPLLAGQFTLKGLGLKEGELLIDKVDRVVSIVQNGEPVRLGAFGDQYVEPSKDSAKSYLRRLLLAANIVILGAVLFWGIWYRMRTVKR